jgi:hypothetical protein
MSQILLAFLNRKLGLFGPRAVVFVDPVAESRVKKWMVCANRGEA